MPVELHIITAREFVRMGAHGQVDWEESRASIANLARACHERHVDHAMLDVRDVRADFTHQQISELVGTFREAGFRDSQRLAVLYDDDPEAKARLFVAFAAERGWNVRAFDNFEEAVDWLAVDEGDSPDFGAGADLESDQSGQPEPPPG